MNPGFFDHSELGTTMRN